MVKGINVHNMPSMSEVTRRQERLEGFKQLPQAIETGSRIEQHVHGLTGRINAVDPRWVKSGPLAKDKPSEVADLEGVRAGLQDKVHTARHSVINAARAMGYKVEGSVSFARLERWTQVQLPKQEFTERLELAKIHSDRAEGFATLKRDLAVATAVLATVLGALVTANLLPIDLGPAAPAAKMLASLPARVGAGVVIAVGVTSTGVAAGAEHKEVREGTEQLVKAQELFPNSGVTSFLEKAELGPKVLNGFAATQEKAIAEKKATEATKTETEETE